MTTSVTSECNNQLDDVETMNDEIDTTPISYAIEVNNTNELNEIQYAIPCNNHNINRRVSEKKEIILSINKTTLLLCVLNLPYVFKNFGFYLLRVGIMMMCQYYGVLKCNVCVLKIYIGETGQNLKDRLNSEYPLIPDWTHYRYDVLPPDTTKDMRVAIETMVIRSYASLLPNKEKIPSMKISDYLLVNKKIDKR